MVGQIVDKIRMFGYVPNVGEARLDAEDEEKESSREAGRRVRSDRLSKNLTEGVRGLPFGYEVDLRSLTQPRREIVVRDRNRFHHFKDGSCSCNDYW
ncbi:hypothetical protein Taro_018846 [Colocasia esculenta]|uniref:DYW domain-containing protein n=1 Tax=Colocasia esculenta TaxID=4460 RepID=A0A843US58_COLES|nr:hypothetical protein [Colocasia esculenta]